MTPVAPYPWHNYSRSSLLFIRPPNTHSSKQKLDNNNINLFYTSTSSPLSTARTTVRSWCSLLVISVYNKMYNEKKTKNGLIFKYFFCYRVFAPSSLIFYIKLCTIHVQKLLSYAYLIWVLLFPFVGPSVPLMPISSIFRGLYRKQTKDNSSWRTMYCFLSQNNVCH